MFNKLLLLALLNLAISSHILVSSDSSFKQEQEGGLLVSKNPEIECFIPTNGLTVNQEAELYAFFMRVSGQEAGTIFDPELQPTDNGGVLDEIQKALAYG